MRPRPLLLAHALLPLLGLPLLSGGDVQADVFSIPAGLPAAPLTLAQALGALAPPKQDLFLTVGADKVRLPPGAAPTSPDDRPGQVGETYGLMARDFGGIMALAPPTMVVLNTKPGVPDPSDGLTAGEALKLLLAALTPSQWAALTSASGLDVSDLPDDAQRAYFERLLPAGALTAFPQDDGVPGPPPQNITLTGPDLRRGARLHLGRRTVIFLPVPGAPPGQFSGSIPSAAAGETHYLVSQPVSPGQRNVVPGITPRFTLPNSPKESDLDYDVPALKQSVSVDGLATVGDLVTRVGRAAGLELYADRRYEGRHVTLVGRHTARAVDLLRAAAFCVTGTFRRVGPAYVLTDDLEGTATRRQRLTRFAAEAERKRHAAVTAAGDSLITAHGGLDALPPLDALGQSEAQRTLPDAMMGIGTVRATFAQLTPAQQDYLTAQVRQGNEAADRAEKLGLGMPPRPRQTLEGPFLLSSAPALFLRCPAVPGPVVTEGLSALELFHPSGGLQMRRAREAAGKDAPPAAPVPVSSALKAALAPYARRTVLAAPRTAAEVAGVVAAMKVLGLNQLWLDVFSDGHSHLESGVLAEALARTKGTGIAVVPALDLLHWGTDAPEDARDLTALGETSTQQEAWEARGADAVDDAPAAGMWACPAAPAVEQTLRAVVRRLAAMPGVTTLAVRGAVPPGYGHAPDSHMGNGDGDLGYVPALRLPFLRRDHADPVDLDVSYDAAYALPGFDDEEATKGASGDWDALRGAVSRDLLRHLLAAGREAKQEAGGGAFRLLVQRRSELDALTHGLQESWYGLWEDPRAPLPEAAGLATLFDQHHPESARSEAQVAHSQSRIALDAFPASYTSSPYIVADSLRKLKPGWDGVVLDATGAEGLTRLARLAGEK